MYNVLIIDDEPWSREVVKALGRWAELGLRIAGEAEDGNEGLRRLAELRPDIVVTDMRMPGVDGVELLQSIHKHYPTIKIIVMSGYDDFMYLKQAIRSNAVEYLLKPINPEELNAALALCREALIKERELSAPFSAMFADGETLQRYIGMRERLYACLLELNREGLTEAFSALMRHLNETVGDRVGRSGNAARITNDLLLMLEKYLSEQQMSLNSLLPGEKWPRILSAENSSAALSLTDLCTIYEETVDAVLAQRLARRRLDMSEVKDYIDAHFQDSITLDSIAGQFLISKEHLSRMFKAYAGNNLSDYIAGKRMEKARRLIATEGMAIKNAAQLAGYEDIAYFYRVFKKHYGITPGDLRKRR